MCYGACADCNSLYDCTSCNSDFNILTLPNNTGKCICKTGF